MKEPFENAFACDASKLHSICRLKWRTSCALCYLPCVAFVSQLPSFLRLAHDFENEETAPLLKIKEKMVYVRLLWFRRLDALQVFNHVHFRFSCGVLLIIVLSGTITTRILTFRVLINVERSACCVRVGISNGNTCMLLLFKLLACFAFSSRAPGVYVEGLTHSIVLYVVSTVMC